MSSELIETMEQNLKEAERTIHRVERLITAAIMKDWQDNNGACLPEEIDKARSILLTYSDRKFGLSGEDVDI